MATKLNKKAGDTIKIKDANNKVIKAKIKGDIYELCWSPYLCK